MLGPVAGKACGSTKGTKCAVCITIGEEVLPCVFLLPNRSSTEAVGNVS